MFREKALMKTKSAAAYLLRLIAAGLGMLFLILMCAWMVRPNLADEPYRYSQAELLEASSSRQINIDSQKPLVFFHEVDYGQGRAGSWYPKGESPILAKLVEQGKLPIVEQRTGPEPVVVEGVDGMGNYGGTWYRITTQQGIPDEILSRLSYVSLVRWSAQGYPIVPHVAKSFEVSEDNRQFIFHLRKGMRWSDGHLFTADDIMFWWNHVANDRTIMADVPGIMKVRGKRGNIEKIDDYTIKITFPEANGIFLAKLASDGMGGKGESYANMLSYPAHYLTKLHPVIGDKELIEDMLTATKLQSATTLFRNILYDTQHYPDYPRLWPWIYQKYKANPPHSFVRNPYYWMVDTQGNQLPYIDRIVFEQKTQEMVPVAAANGEVSMQARFIPYEEYTHLMSQRKSGDYQVYHWYPGDRSLFVIACNINYKIDPNKPETRERHKLLNDKRFRRALSLAINRKAIIKAEYNGQTEPAQCAPGPASYFYKPELYHSFTEYDPNRANELLDEIGLSKRDYEGFRTFPDGSRTTFYLNVATSFGSPGIMQLVVDDWARVGVRVVPRLRNRRLFYVERMGLQHDLNVWLGNSEFIPIVSPRYFLPITNACNYAIGFARWYQKGGLYGDPRAKSSGCIEPPKDSACLKVMELYEKTCSFSDPAEQKEIFDEILKINAENLWTINISTPPPVLVLVKNGLRNVPKNAVSCWEFKSPGNAGIETYFFQNPYNHPSVIAEIADSVLNVKMPPRLVSFVDSGDKESSPIGRFVARVIKYAVCVIAVLLLILVAVKHPYIGRRLIIMVPTLLLVSVVIFSIIQAPPGDYLTSRIMMLEELGDAAKMQEVKDLREMFWLDQPVHVQYARWLGLYWFKTFDPKDEGLLQGNLGRSMDGGQPVNSLVGDRIILTILISLGTILFTWTLAIPIGIYSAVRQYSVADYIFTFLGFIGMCIPSFLLALVIIYFSRALFGVSISGLFSSQYGAQPEWDWAKFIDLLKHIWMPIVVLGVGGTAGMIRIMRANLLDELKKPYVITAKAKGVRPVKLLFKYPVRMALNPFISGIGALFPQLVSGGAIVAVVLSLPTVGPMMLDALMMEDMYLAGSMLMVLSLLGVFGTLISDLLLLWLDPRIRFKAGTR
jgi:ABC-type dipeptide/oligopeptide/nickel transport system permease component/ABC-type transport system substrate-binding protein